MNEDFITRLRGQLVDAADRPARRPALRLDPLRPVLVMAAVLVVLVLGATALRPAGGEDRPVAAAGTVVLQVTGAPAAAAAGILQERLDAAELTGDVRAAEGEVLVDLEEDTPAARRTLGDLLQRGRLTLYDWEGSLVSDQPLGREEAARIAGDGPERTAVEHEGEWYVVDGPPALANPDVAGAEQAADPVTGDPIVQITFTEAGDRAFHDLTRAVAERGADLVTPGASPVSASHRFAIVLDGRVLALPYINYQELPDGLDGGGAQIGGGLTTQSARELAAVIAHGPMIGTLAPR